MYERSNYMLAILMIGSLIISTLGQGTTTIDPALIKEIFNLNPEDIMVASTTGPTTISKEDGDCVCVPYYLCDPDGNNLIQDGTLDGFGQLDVRFRQECRESVEMCCNKPRDPTDPVTPRPPTTPKRTGCGVRNALGVEFQILGGATNDSEFAEFPWTVAILNSADSSSVCAGSLIHHQVVLTGAHCVKKFSQRLYELKIRAGEWDTQTTKERIPYQERNIAKIVTHPSFNEKTLAFDVALLFLSEPVNVADNIDTICLPQQDENLDNKKSCFVTGWGKTRFGKTGSYSVIMKKVEMDMVPSKLCETQFQRTRLGPRFKLHNTFSCAGGKEGVDACQGDGGAPLVCPGVDDRYYQSGIVAWGIGCGAKNVPGAYGRVSSFRNWIDVEMGKTGRSSESYTAK